MSTITNNMDQTCGINVNEICKNVMGAIKECQKMANELQGWRLYADYDGVQQVMTKLNYQILHLTKKIFTHNSIGISLDNGSIISQFDVIREANDALLEKLNSHLDDASGIRRTADLEILDTTVHTLRGRANENNHEIILLASRNVQKPQMFFVDKINNSKEPFLPLLKEKPHSLKPLSILLCVDSCGREYYSQPYDYELEHWTPQPEQLTKVTPIEPLPLESTPLDIISSEEALKKAVEELSQCKEIAVDLEAHNFRSYQGLTCLLQISSRSRDYIIDPLELRGKLTILNEVFANPKILKVFHGADLDILWLQRDLGVYVVNMFDTHQAAILLDYPHRSLAALLLKFCSISANKTYQRADWRIRPLPADFINYARQDTHYLLYIYESIQNELIEKGSNMNLITATYNRGTSLCQKRYEKPVVDTESHLILYRKSRRNFNGRQLYALKQIFEWRDKLARKEDESVEYILPWRMLLQIADLLPKEMQGILACCNPIPLFVKTEQLTLHYIIRDARKMSLAEVESSLVKPSKLQATTVVKASDANHFGKHDFSLIDDNVGLPTLLGTDQTLFGNLFTQAPIKAELCTKSVLFGSEKDIKFYRKKTLSTSVSKEFMSPYHRYIAYLQIQPLLDECRKNADKVSNEERIRNVLSFVSSVTQKSNEEEQMEIEAQELEKREAEEILEKSATLKTDEDDIELEEPPAPTFNEFRKREKKSGRERKKKSRMTIVERIKAELPALNLRKSKKKKKKALKSENASATPTEETNLAGPKNADLMESSDGVPHMESTNVNGVKPKKRKSLEGQASNVKKAKTNVEVQGVTPFDYAGADLSIFKKKDCKGKFGQIRQHFKGKRNKPSAGQKRFGLKSLTWGIKK